MGAHSLYLPTVLAIGSLLRRPVPHGDNLELAVPSLHLILSETPAARTPPVIPTSYWMNLALSLGHVPIPRLPGPGPQGVLMGHPCVTVPPPQWGQPPSPQAQGR